MSAPTYSLKFISGKYQGGEFSLTEGADITVGRAADLEMVLFEEMVSRKHARITCRKGEIAIQDLGSTNGTFVNGERIRAKARLKNGDRILIGTSILKLIHRTDHAHSGMKSLEESQQKREDTPQGHALAGRLEDITLPELLQLLSASRKDGTLAVRSKRQRGRIALKEGRVVHCSITDRELDPRKAFYRLLSWAEGSFELQKAGEGETESPFAESTEALLMGGVRQLDELKHIAAELPRPEDVLLLQQPILPPLRNLTPELLDTLQIVHNLGRVESILDQSAASDLDTYQELLYLLKNRYIRRA